MNILFVHNRYQHLGGEDGVLDAEMELMSTHGHRVALAMQDNASIDTLKAKVRSALNVAYSADNRVWMSQQITQFRPDIVHVHNFFPLLTPSIYDACADHRVPVVQTLHNFRIICPGGLLLRNGQVCEKCVGGSAYNAVWHRCYRDSVVGSFAVARMVQKHRSQSTWSEKVDRIIALTDFAKSKFSEAGIPVESMSVKPNFVTDANSSPDPDNARRGGALFVGRLSAEKGVATLAGAWRSLDVPLRVAGSGPLDNEFQSLDDKTVHLLGRLDRNAVFNEIRQADFLIVPSECYEGFPLVIAEAFMLGTPVLASRLGSMAEIIEDGVTGRLFDAGSPEDLSKQVRWMREHPDRVRQMGMNARREYEKKYTPGRNHELLMRIYQEAAEHQAKNSRAR